MPFLFYEKNRCKNIYFSLYVTLIFKHVSYFQAKSRTESPLKWMKKQHLTHTTRQLKKISLQQEGGQADTTIAQKSRVRTKHPNTGC